MTLEPTIQALCILFDHDELRFLTTLQLKNVQKVPFVHSISAKFLNRNSTWQYCWVGNLSNFLLRLRRKGTFWDLLTCACYWPHYRLKIAESPFCSHISENFERKFYMALLLCRKTCQIFHWNGEEFLEGNFSSEEKLPSKNYSPVPYKV